MNTTPYMSTQAFTSSTPAHPGDGDFHEAVQRFLQKLGIDLHGSEASTVAADLDSPDRIRATAQTMLNSIQHSAHDSGKLSAILGRLLDVLLILNDIGGEVGSAFVRAKASVLLRQTKLTAGDSRFTVGRAYLLHLAFCSRYSASSSRGCIPFHSPYPFLGHQELPSSFGGARGVASRCL